MHQSKERKTNKMIQNEKKTKNEIKSNKTTPSPTEGK